MIKSFKIGQNSLEVSQIIVKNCPEIIQLKLISHKVEKNWRQVNSTFSSKTKNILRGFNHDKPIKEIVYDRDRFLGLNLAGLEKLETKKPISIINNFLN